MRQRPRAAAAALSVTALFVGVLSGCGGGGSERLSRAALARVADAICERGLEDADRLRGQTVPGARGEAAAAEIDETLEVLRRQVDGFADLQGPASTDAELDRAVEQLRIAAEGLETLREAALDGDRTVDEAVEENQPVVEQVNRAAARANDSLAALGFLGCIGFTGG